MIGMEFCKRGSTCAAVHVPGSDFMRDVIQKFTDSRRAQSVSDPADGSPKRWNRVTRGPEDHQNMLFARSSQII